MASPAAATETGAGEAAATCTRRQRPPSNAKAQVRGSLQTQPLQVLQSSGGHDEHDVEAAAHAAPYGDDTATAGHPSRRHEAGDEGRHEAAAHEFGLQQEDA
jgi:hypothetical protein